MTNPVGLIDGKSGLHQAEEPLGIGAAAEEAGAMAGCEGGHLVEKEKRGVTPAHRLMVLVSIIKLAADPMMRSPAAAPQRLVVAMKPAAAIAHHGATRLGRDDPAERRHPAPTAHR